MRDVFEDALSDIIGILGEDSAEYISPTGEALPFKSIYTNSYEFVETDSYAGISGANRVLSVDTKNIPFSPKSRDKIRFRGKVYEIANTYEDTFNGLKLVLKEID